MARLDIEMTILISACAHLYFSSIRLVLRGKEVDRL